VSPFLQETQSGQAGARVRKSAHIPALDGIRAIAILIVFVAHSEITHFFPGGFGVSVFFFLSGYLITTLLRKEFVKTGSIALRSFYQRRALRILPPMYLSLLVGWYLAKAGGLSEHGNLFGLLSTTFYLYNYTALFHLPAVVPLGMSLLWSLMVEEHFYLIFPWVYRRLQRQGLTRERQTTVLLIACACALLWRCCLVWVFHTSLITPPIWTYIASDARFDSILAGSILAIRNNPFCGDKSPLLNRYKGILASAGIFILLVAIGFQEPHFRETLRYTMQSAGLYLVFYYCLSSPTAWQVSWLEWKPIRWLGWVSYSVYLVHLLLFNLGWHWFPQARPLVVLGVAVISLGYAWLMRLLVEEPLRKRRS
jgi:peptidoglycan/LPS O-acetylase OafA/YrhL